MTVADLRLLVDLQAAQSVAHGERGIARYSIELTRALLREGAPIDAITLNPNLPNPRRLPIDLATSPLLQFATARTMADSHRRGPFAYVVMSPIELDLPAPLVLSRAGLDRSDSLVVVLYDLIPLIFADRYLADPRVREPYLARLSLIRDADLVLAVSEHTRRDAIEYLGIAPDRVVAIGGGVADTFVPAGHNDDPGALVRERLPAVRGDFVLTVAGDEWRKNTEALIDAYGRMAPELRAAHQLVIACAVSLEGERAWRSHAARAGVQADQLVITGYIDDALLRALYQATSLFVFPSRYEGYGLPALEAARCGAPVITSNNSTLPEVLDLAESTFAPDDVDAIAERMHAGLTDAGLRARLLEAGARAGTRNTWDAVADRAINAFRELAPRTTSRRRKILRPRIAVIGPLPPVESGIALYNDRVLRALSWSDVDLELFVEAPAGVGRTEPPIDVPCYPIDALGTRLDPHDYDTILYTIGNSACHVRTFDLARRVPGVVWLHDAYLIGLHLEWALWQIRSRGRATDVLTIFREEIALLYAGRVPAEHVLVEPLSHHAFVERQVYLNAGLVRRARHLVLNSELARDMVQFDAGPDGVLAPTTILHHAIPHAAVLPLPHSVSNRARRLVVALGVVHAIKRPDVVMRAVALLGLDVDLAFVGPCEPDVARWLQALADDLGLRDRVTITGFVDVPTYAQWISEATLALQLRDVSFGESSGAVHDAIAARLPVITSIASAAELPADVVAMVADDCSVDDLVATMRRIVDDPDTQRRMRAACDAYASTWTFTRVATEIKRVLLADAWSRG